MPTYEELDSAAASSDVEDRLRRIEAFMSQMKEAGMETLVESGYMLFGSGLRISQYGIISQRRPRQYTLEMTAGNFGASIPVGNEDIDQNNDGFISVLDLSYLASHYPPRDASILWVDRKNVGDFITPVQETWTDGATPSRAGGSYPISSLTGIAMDVPDGAMTEQTQASLGSSTTWGYAGVHTHGSKTGSTDADASVYIGTEKSDVTIKAGILVYSEDDGVSYVAIKDSPLWLPALSADPSAPSDGYLWYNSTDDKLYARINGATVELGAGGGSVITPALLAAPALDKTINLTAPSAAAWTTANTAVYVPFELFDDRTVTEVIFNKGAVAGNVNCALYNEDASGKPGAIIGSALGSTAVSAGANAPQVLNITDQALTAGRYFVGIVFDTVTTLTLTSWSGTAPTTPLVGVYTEASAFSLPSTATPVFPSGNLRIPSLLIRTV